MKKWNLAVLLTLLILALAKAADTEPGYLGVYVSPVRGGMQITAFIKGTPAGQLEASGEMSRGDLIVKLAGRSIASLEDLKAARGLIKPGEEAKMVLRDRRGNIYHVWVSRTSFGAVSAIETRPGGDESVLPGAPFDRSPSETTKALADRPQQSEAADLAIRDILLAKGPSTRDLSQALPGGSPGGPGGVNNNSSSNSSAPSGNPQSGGKSQGNGKRGAAPAQQASLPRGNPDVLSKGDRGDGGTIDFRERVSPRKPVD